MKKIQNRDRAKSFCGIVLLLLISTNTYSQLSPVKSQFFQNPYLINPSMAGNKAISSVFLNYCSQLERIEGAPVFTSISASTPINNKASIGLNLLNDQAGLLKRSQAMASLAYQVMFSPKDIVRFGVSLSMSDNRIDRSGASSSAQIDPGILNYDNKTNYLDGNFGLTYTRGKFQSQFSYLNLNGKRLREYSTADYSTFYSSISYEFDLDSYDELKVRPLIAYRGVYGHENLWDIAAEWQFKQLMLYSMYHSNGSVSGGFGFEYNKRILISGIYGSPSGEIGSIYGGQFDLTLGLKF